MAKILEGKKVRDEIARKLQKEISKMKAKPTLAVIQIGDLSESNAYIGQKKLFAEKIAANFKLVRLKNNLKEETIIKEIKKLNKDKKINGLIVQMPMPRGLNRRRIIEAIDPLKDVDGLTAASIFTPATARGILTLLQYYKFPIKGKHVVIVGRSNLVGKPTAELLLSEDATVTVAHSKTADLSAVTKRADILIVAAGVPKLINSKHVKKDQVIIDVGINVLSGKLRNHKLEDEISAPKMVGDVDFKAVSKIVKAISSVPGGVGPMTVASLFQNLVDASKRQNVKM